MVNDGSDVMPLLTRSASCLDVIVSLQRSWFNGSCIDYLGTTAKLIGFLYLFLFLVE